MSHDAEHGDEAPLQPSVAVDESPTNDEQRMGAWILGARRAKMSSRKDE
jgi:hypothetical protein